MDTRSGSIGLGAHCDPSTLTASRTGLPSCMTRWISRQIGMSTDRCAATAHNRTRREYAFDDLLNPALRSCRFHTTSASPNRTIGRLIVGTREDQIPESGKAHEGLSCSAQFHRRDASFRQALA